MAPSDTNSFTVASLRFLKGLERNNQRPWFEARRDVYEQSIKAPMLHLIQTVCEQFSDYAPDHVGPAHKLMLRIYRDTRFSEDKRPYKTRVAAWWGHSALRRTSGAGFYFHLAPTECVVAAGIFMPDPVQLRAIRTALLTSYPKVRKQLALLKKAGLAEMPQSQSPLPLPRGFEGSHPAASLFRQRQWGVERTCPAEEVLKPEFAETLLGDFRSAAPLVRLLNHPLVGDSAE